MYLRMVEATVKEDGDIKLENLYTEVIIEALKNTGGCIFAGLLRRRDQPRRYISMTLWNSEKEAEDYVKSGDFRKNVESVQHTRKAPSGKFSLPGITQWNTRP